MRFPLNFHLSPAPALLLAVLAAHCAAAWVFVHAVAGLRAAQADSLSVPLLAAAGCGLLALSLWLAVRSEHNKRGVAVVLHEDGILSLVRDGRIRDYRVDGSAVDFGWVVWLPLRSTAALTPRQARIGVRLMLLPANLPPGHWRGLRIWLRHKAVATDESRAAF